MLNKFTIYLNFLKNVFSAYSFDIYAAVIKDRNMHDILTSQISFDVFYTAVINNRNITF